jgi:predicted RNA-binding Zn-ribbon protein involved in translation (DUF1610 family)
MNALDMAIQILRDVRPDLYSKHPRAYLERLASGEAVRELQEQIESTREELAATREELSQYRCPYCGSELVSRVDAPLDREERDWDTVESFACGYQQFGGAIQQPCPGDPRFPKFEDFDLTLKHTPDEPHFKWTCLALGKTDMARRVHLLAGLGTTKEEAEAKVREHYDGYARRPRVL